MNDPIIIWPKGTMTGDPCIDALGYGWQWCGEGSDADGNIWVACCYTL